VKTKRKFGRFCAGSAARAAPRGVTSPRIKQDNVTARSTSVEGCILSDRLEKSSSFIGKGPPATAANANGLSQDMEQIPSRLDGFNTIFLQVFLSV
jgi:hypothetical protein